ncbi:MAG: thiamine biosynthesis protein ThiS, partial [Planctomycetales bacterium]|nr:thiamine biosynthesis protein ThiS [Planctomycetales bacterium]NIM09753.1 thiamine biosynthesis protein ThiS [Planctomycetales bacterium]NIN09221.1 thiamine biosynthesis protein ThiS [Planctomycetales bacterium]NIN78321.1 thiamine biosynthesis protein ThiS [Planctomycetales bacterium]NIP05399.1 thiamine biosynthesis protein ThiS [Planctomycetales bacterium]
MRIRLHQPKRELDYKGPRRVREILKDLEILPETVLVIRGDDLATEDETIR